MIEPYYDQDGITIFNADCLDVMRDLDLAVCVLVSDPPYGMAYVSNSSKYRSGVPVAGDEDAKLRDRMIEAWGGIGPALVFGNWRVQRPAGTRHRLIWDKGDSPGMGDLSIPWGPGDEEIYVIGDGFVGTRRTNVIRHKMLSASDAERPNHPTPKPVPLMRDLISYCPPSLTVLDPFMGSGTTLRAAKDLGRRAIGIEINKDYCDIAIERLRQGVLL